MTDNNAWTPFPSWALFREHRALYDGVSRPVSELRQSFEVL